MNCRYIYTQIQRANFAYPSMPLLVKILKSKGLRTVFALIFNNKFPAIILICLNKYMNKIIEAT